MTDTTSLPSRKLRYVHSTVTRGNPNSPPIITDQIVVECEVGGGFQIGLHDDAPGPFPSRAFAQAVATAAERRNHVGQRADVRVCAGPQNCRTRTP